MYLVELYTLRKKAKRSLKVYVIIMNNDSNDSILRKNFKVKYSAITIIMILNVFSSFLA